MIPVLVLAAGMAAAAGGGASAEDPTPVRAFRSFDRRTHRGLPQSTVMTLAQDDEGVLWIGTLDGLATFDGVEIRTVPRPEGLPSFGAVWAVVPRRRGGVFVGGNAGVHAYDGRGFRFLPPRRSLVSLAEAPDGSLLVVDQAGGLWRCPDPGVPPTWERVDAKALPGPAVAVVAGENDAWVAGRDGVVRLSGARAEPLAAGRGPGGGVSALAAAKDGTIWVGTQEGGLFWTTREATAWTRVDVPGWDGGRIRCLAEDRAGRVWAGGSDGRVAFGRRSGPWTRWGPGNGLKPSGVLALRADREGTLWLGFNGNGLQQWVGEAWSHRNFWSADDPTSLRPQVFGVAQTRDGFLAAAFSKGIWRWDGHRILRYGRAEGITEDVRHAVEPAPGEVWVGARFGIFESRGGAPFRKTLAVESGFVTGLFRAPDGAWYAATSGAGVFVRSGREWKAAQAINRTLPEPNVRGMTWLRNGELWMATLSGVTIFRQGSAESLSADSQPGLPEGVNAVLEVGDDEVWVGGNGGVGVRRAGRWRLLTSADGLPGRSVYALARGVDGSIWVGGSEGVGRFSEGRWQIYDSRNGLIEDECNLNGLFVAPDGSVYVGTMASLARFDPTVETLPAPALRLRWRETPQPGRDGVARLSAGRRSLHLVWAAPWLKPGAVEYRARVARLSADWSAPSRRSDLTIENLGPGRWTFEVEARLEGAGGEAWSQPLTLQVQVAPHPWETAWAGLALAGLLAAAAFGLVRLRTYQLQRRQRQLLRAVDEAMASVKVLSGLLPICASCKKVRDDKGYWNQIEAYIRERSQADFSHGICPDCFRRLYPGYEYKDDSGA